MKRLFDAFFSGVFLLLLSPLFLILIFLIFLCDGAPVFFSQVRAGLHGEAFTIYKFRTMAVQKNHCGQSLPASDRITCLGYFLRKTSLDELPQLWNVLKGDLSLVGPRPLIIEYLPLYSKEQARRHLVRPGITGLAQVRGRNGLSWEERFLLDVWYVDHQSWRLDIKVLLLTVKKVFCADNIAPPDGGIMPKFKGGREDNN
ncbi:MAG: sugar transferase [Gammaproteobacteria bacterium CG11_big_fil_rev_8_21_14_0_20_46_22]|nr:MAG: sugar transferase [Gammaproteobacteria bacterium CG12_big_fil_rev_8_21_14_0_65_46_12]PIR12146.1 MAG: sugar transferase [Gammaproteobacteria bacterium CG11_big_fil_rev_8_21_14_0_20_46_22]